MVLPVHSLCGIFLELGEVAAQQFGRRRTMHRNATLVYLREAEVEGPSTPFPYHWWLVRPPEVEAEAEVM